MAVGYLNLVSYNEQKMKLIIVPIKDKYGFDKQQDYRQLKDSLDAIYKSAITYWDVSISDPLDVDFEDNDKPGLDTELPDLAAFNREMKNIRNALQKRDDYDKDAYYLFLVDKSENGNKNGIMPFKRHFGFIFMNDQGKLNEDFKKLSHTIAHELGHCPEHREPKGKNLNDAAAEHTWNSRGLSSQNSRFAQQNGNICLEKN